MADAVLAHLVSRVAPGVDVVFLDTGLHFPETLRVRDRSPRTLPVNVRSIRPRQTVGQQDGEYGPRLFARDPDECCLLRKVEPLERALADYDAWAAGLRRDESPTRANTPVVAFDARRGKVKVNPIARLDPGRRGRVHRPLRTCRSTSCSAGATRSIGCWPCTRRTQGRRGPAGRPLGHVREDRVRPARLTARYRTAASRRSCLVAHGSRDPRAARGHPGAGPARWRRPGPARRCRPVAGPQPSRGPAQVLRGLAAAGHRAAVRGAAAAHRRLPRPGGHSRLRSRRPGRTGCG